MLTVDKVYLAHYSPLKDRKDNVQNEIQKNSISVDWIEDEPEEEEVGFIYKKQLWNSRIKEMNFYDIPERMLKKSEISLEYKHIKIYEDIIKNNINTALVLEDDIILEDNFVSKFNFSLSMTPKDWDVIFIGSGCNLHIENKHPHIIAYKKDHPASKCTDSYVIKKKAVEKIFKTIIPFCFPIDFELNYQMYINNLNVYWWEPTLVKQGSQNGLYGSSIQ